MLSDQQIEKIGLYFALLNSDAKIAMENAERVVARLKRDPKKQPSEFEVLQTCRMIQSKHAGKSSRDASVTSVSLFARHEIDLNVWYRFLSEGEDGEVEAVVLTQILGIENTVATRLLNISAGTLKTRVARGVLNIGQTIRSKTK